MVRSCKDCKHSELNGENWYCNFTYPEFIYQLLQMHNIETKIDEHDWCSNFE